MTYVRCQIVTEKTVRLIRVRLNKFLSASVCPRPRTAEIRNGRGFDQKVCSDHEIYRLKKHELTRFGY